MGIRLNLSVRVKMRRAPKIIRVYRLTIEYREALPLNISEHSNPYFNSSFRPKSMMFTSEEVKEQ